MPTLPDDADALGPWDADSPEGGFPPPPPLPPPGLRRSGTIPPPEMSAPSSARELVLTRAQEALADAARVRAPILRRALPEAEEAKLRSALLHATTTGDTEGELRAAGALARLLAARGLLLEEAIDLARRALGVGDDPGLRAELAGWLAGLGEPGLAAAALLELSRRADATRPPARTLVKVGILMARSGDAAGALEMWSSAAETDPADPTGLELFGMAEAWCPEDCQPGEALNAYLEAARRRAAAGDPDAANQDRLRALAVAELPGMEADGAAAVRAIAQELRGAGKLEAADEALRALAARLVGSSPDQARELHEERLRSALDEGAFVRATAAAIDGRMLTERGELGQLVDRALRGAGLEALAKGRTSGKTEETLSVVFDPSVEPAVHARAFAALGGEVGGPTGALLLSIAAELESASGAAELARGHARDAFGLDAASLRALNVLSDLLGREGGRASANLVEQSGRRGVMRIRTCLRLADLLRDAGDPEASVAWLQRALALRPGDGRLIERLIDGAIDGGSLAKVEEVVLWTLAQPRPSGDVLPYLLRALERATELESSQLSEGEGLPRSAALARRALDVLGPKSAEVRAALRQIAERAGDLQLVVSLLERAVAVEHEDEAARSTLLELASLREQGGDFDGAIRELYRALSREADPQDIRERIFAADEARSDAGAELGSDAEIARAAVLAATAPTGPSTTEALEGAEAYRTLAAVVFDAAGDVDGADASLLQADYLTREAGVSRYAQDLAQLLGTAVAADRIRDRVAEVAAAEDSSEEDRRIHASLALQAAQVASDGGIWSQALRLAELALSLEPTRADALAMVERCAEQTGELAAVDQAYETAGRAALGCYGRRAAHYRAARLLERKGDLRSALRHAIQSFEAVPTEGQGFQMVVRLSAQTGEPAEAARAIARVADGMKGDHRVSWLLRAAQTTSDTEEGLRTKVDIMLRALSLRADGIVVRELGAAVERLAALGADLEVERLRFARGCESVLAKAEGPDGARAGVELARVAVVAFDDHETVLGSLQRAMRADGDIDEYAELVPLVPAMVRAPGEAGVRPTSERLLALVVHQVSQPYASIGGALLRFGARLAEELGDEEQRARMVLEAARKASEDSALVVSAFDAVQRHVGTSLEADLRKSFARIPQADRFEALRALSRTRAASGDAEGTARAVEETARAAPRDDAERDAWLDELSELCGQAGGDAELALDRVLFTEVERRADPRAVARPGKLLAGRLSLRGEVGSALQLLVALAERGVPTDTLSREIGEIARAASEGRADVNELPVGGAETSGRMAILRMLADALRDTGSPVSLEAYRRVVEQAPGDAGALEGLEQAASAAGDHTMVAELLAKKIQRTGDAPTKRALRLRRAAILEQRLGRAADARAELEAQLADTPEDTLVMRFLADLLERSKEPRTAAELWARLGDLTSSADERAEYGLRVVRCQIASGELAAAEETLASIATFAPREQALELRVQLARKVGDSVQLADALEELAAASQAPAEHRATHLVEAAEANVHAERFDLAPEQVVRALRLAPHDGRVVTAAHRVAYLLRGGPGDAAEGKQTAADLVRVFDSVPSSEVEVHAFLLAEALDAALPDKGAGERELAKRHAELGSAPLVALGLAERLAQSSDRRAQALALFERALNGDLRGLRTGPEVAFQAAQTAAALGQNDKATGLFALAASDPQLRRDVVERMAALGLAAVEPPARVARRTPAPAATASQEAATASQEAATGSQEAATASQEAATGSQEAATGSQEAATAPQEAPPAQQEAPPAPQEAPPVPQEETEVLDEPDDVLSVDEDDLLQEPDNQRVVSPRSDIRELRPSPAAVGVALRPPPLGAPEAVPDGADEASLFRELMSGSYRAGEALVSLYGSELSHHAREFVALRRQQAVLRPGDPDTLGKLHQAAKLDGNVPLTRAVEHVLLGFTTGRGIEPPTLAAQQAPELVHSLLFRDITVPIFEALALVWDSSIYKRDLSYYQLTGLERVQPGPAGPIAERLGEVARALGLKRPSLYYQRQNGPLRGSVALIQPPAAVFRGELREDPRELQYAIGAMLTATAPEYVLAIALPEEQGSELVDALLAAFAPVDQAPPSRASGVVRIEQSLWQLIPRRSERRLRELCADVASFRFELAAVGARQAMRRAGLFACGDVPTAVRMTMSELGADADLPFASEGGLAEACSRHPEVADLVLLATSAEYAEARWSSRK